MNESWRYRVYADIPAIDYHFLMVSGNWHFAPILNHPYFYGEKVRWARVFNGGGSLNIMSMEEAMAGENQFSISEGLTTDRHSWKKGTRLMELPYALASFRGANGKTEVEIFYGLRQSSIKKYLHQNSDAIAAGLQVSDSDYGFDSRWIDTLRSSAMPSVGNLLVDQHQLNLNPGAYTIGFHAEPLATPLIGSRKFSYRVKDYSANRLMMSDMILAARISPAHAAGKFARRHLRIIPNPTGRFDTSQPFYVYFELYNLRYDNDGNTAFKIEYALTQLKRHRRGLAKVLGLFRKSRMLSTSLSTQRTGNAESSCEYLAIDASIVDGGHLQA